MTKVKVVSESVSGSRSWWVSTKTGMWNGGSSPHQPCQGSSPHGPGPPPNLPRPMISAPTFASASSTTAVLAFTSPPSLPWGSRHALSANDPLVQALAALAERLLLALVRPGDVAVRRDRDVDSHLARAWRGWCDSRSWRRILVGTSSWADPGFVKEWYPPKMPARERLPWYAQRFEAVELNSSFYAIPDRNWSAAGWRPRPTTSSST